MMQSALSWGLRRLRPAVGWPVFLLAVGAVSVAAWGVMDADWIEGDALFVSVALVAALAGAVLAHVRISGQAGLLILAMAGVGYVGNAVSRFAWPLWAGLGELGQILAWLNRRLWQPGPAWPFPPLDRLRESGARLAVLGRRLASWLTAWLAGRTEYNPTAFLFVAGLLLWACAAWAMWSVVRHKGGLAGWVPLGVLVGTSAYFGDSNLAYLFAFVGCVVLLMPAIQLSRDEQRWDRQGIDYSLEIRFDVWQVAVLVTLAVLLLALVTPAINFSRLVNAFWNLVSQPQEALRQFVVRFFGGVEPPPVAVVPVGTGSAALPRAHLLGGDPDLSGQAVMSVCLSLPPPVEDPPLGPSPGPHYYWRGATYDRYDGQGWSNGPGTVVEVPIYRPVIELPFTATQRLRQHFTILSPGRVLYAAGEPQLVDQPVYSRQRAPDDLIGLEWSLVHQGRPTDYVVISQVPAATRKQLMAAPEVYPEGIVAHYLFLPSTLPERVQTLAWEVVRGVQTPYEKAWAVETYLRQFEYDLRAPSPPPGRDVVDYFLFEAQQGYCDYFASAFVVLVRAVGVPARLAVGYGSGSYSQDEGCYAVSEMNAHSWPEVYFSGYGWIPFEPTASFARFERPQDVGPASPAHLPPALPERAWHVAWRAWWQRMGARQGGRLALSLIALCALAGLALVGLSLVGWRRQRWQARLSAAEAVALGYEGLRQWGKALGVTPRLSDTPAEYDARLGGILSLRIARWPWPDRICRAATAQLGQDAGDLCLIYQRASYSQGGVNVADRRRVEGQWRRLRRRVGWLWLISRSTTDLERSMEVRR